MNSSDFAQPPPPKRQRTESGTSSHPYFETQNGSGNARTSSSRSFHETSRPRRNESEFPGSGLQYGRAMTGTTEKSEDDGELFTASDMGLEVNGDMGTAFDVQHGGNEFVRADSSGSAVGKDKDSDGVYGSGKGRPLAVTCTHCRSRKIKCDNGKPSCNNCVKAGADCVYLTKQKPGLKAGTGETMLKRIEALEDSFTAYRRYNDQHVAQLEHTIRQNITSGNGLRSMYTLGSDSSFDASRQAASPIESVQQGDLQQRLKRESVAAGMLDLATGNSAMRNPRNNTGAIYEINSTHPVDHALDPHITGGSGHRMSFSGHSPLSQQHQQLLQPNQSPSSMSMMPPTGNSPLQMYPYNSTDYRQTDDASASYEAPIWVEGASLPRDDIVRDLIRLFFAKVAPWAFIIIPMVDRVWEPPWDVVAHAMVVISLRFSKDERVISIRDQIYNAARHHVFIQAMDTTTIETMQALAILALDVIGSGKGPEHWSVLSLLTRAAITMDLLRESDTQQSPEMEASMAAQPGVMKFPSVLSKTRILQPAVIWQDDEARRRLFWLIFVLDRYTCTATAWDIAIPQADIKRRLPCANEIWKGAEWFQADTFMSPLNLYGRSSASLATLHPSAFLVEALDLLGRAHALQSRPVDVQDPRAMESRKDATSAITSAANRWYHDIQPAIGRMEDERPLEPLHLLTHAMYHATILKLQGFHAYPTITTTTGIIEPYATQCLASARAICNLSCRATVRDANAPAVSPVFIWTCWIAARIMFVHACLSAQTNMEPEFKILLSSLRIMAEEWQLADEYVKLLSRAERRWQSLATDLNSPASGTLSEAVSVLLDMRRTAYTAAKIGQYDVTPPEPAGGQTGGPFGIATPVWPPTLKGPFAQATGYGDIGSWFDSLDLFGNSSMGLLP